MRPMGICACEVLLRGFGHELHERGHVGLDEAGADRVDPDALAHQLARQLLGEPPHAGLRHAVRQASRRRDASRRSTRS